MRTIRPLCRRGAVPLMWVFAVSSAAQAETDAQASAESHRLQAMRPPHGKAVSGAQRGNDAAGRGIGRADAAARHGIERGSEVASQPVRKVGESLGRKLAPGSSGRATPPQVGPQGQTP